MKVMIKRNSSSSSSSSSNTDGRTETTTSCKKMKSNSSCSIFSPKNGERGEEGNRSVTRNGNIESTEKVLPQNDDVTDEVMMMKKILPSSSPRSSPTSHPSYSSSSHQSAPISPSSFPSPRFSPNNMTRKRNRSSESNSKNDIMTTTLPSEEEHSIEEKREREDGKFIPFSDNSFGWHPHVYHQTPKKLTAFSIIDILNRDDSITKNSSTKSPSSHSNNNSTADVIEERKKKTCNNKLNRKQRSPSIPSPSSSSIAQNASSVHSSSSSPTSPSLPSKVVPSSLSSSPLLLHQLHHNNSTKPTTPLISSAHLLSHSPIPRTHSNRTKKPNLLLSRGSKAYKKEAGEQEDHYQVCHSLLLLHFFSHCERKSLHLLFSSPFCFQKLFSD